MLKGLQLKNYKGFKDTGELEIRPITLILGKNSSGKSSLCKLLPILRDALLNPDRPFPLKSAEGVMLSSRYQNLFHNLEFMDMSATLAFDDNYYLESHYMILNGVFCNYQRSAGTRICDPSGKEPFQMMTLHKSNAIIQNNFFDSELLSSADESNSHYKFDVNFIGPIRCEAPESLKKSDAFVNTPRDDKGRYAYTKLLESAMSDGSLIQSVSDWLHDNMEGQRLQLEYTDTLMTQLAPYIVRNRVSLHLSEVGEGMTQVLPIIIQSFIDAPNSITVLEQPVLHLHPSAHSKVAERLAMSSKTTGQHYVIESHSHNLMLGFIRMVANREIDFSPKDIVIYYIDADSAPFHIDKIEVLEDGTLTQWPHGIFEESLDLQEQILDRK